MQRFILSAFTVLLATAASAPEALALKPVDADFNLQSQRLAELDARNKGAISPTFKLHSQRLAELDARNKSEDNSQPYYSQPSTEPAAQGVSTEQESTQKTEPTAWENADSQEQPTSPAISLLERRHQSLDQS
ncbi:MAG: hypothetical protein AAFQ95_10925 [Cyanobacteria bacterium J06621_3]